MAHQIRRSTITGRFISNAAAKRWPGRSVTETIGKGTNNSRPVTRSAVDGRFVPKMQGESDPKGTWTQKV